MALTVQEIADSRKLGKLIRILVTPWTSETEEGTNASFDLKNVVADTTTIDEADPTINDIACETSDTPNYQIITQGAVTVALSSVEMPNEFLEKCMGYTIDDAGNAYRPAAYQNVYLKYQFVFDSSDDILEIPKVMSVGKITGSSLTSNMIVGAMSGTAYPKDYTVTKEAGEVVVSTAYIILKGKKAELMA